jgi:hypothetical protein
MKSLVALLALLSLATSSFADLPGTDLLADLIIK